MAMLKPNTTKERNMMFKSKLIATLSTLSVTLFAGQAMAMNHQYVKGMDQSLTDGTVTASEIHSHKNGWLVVHKTNDDMKPGPVVGYAPLKSGINKDVTAILMEPIDKNQKLMLMLHGEDGGMKTGVFEYTLGAKEDGPVKVDGKLVMAVITAS